MPTLALNSCKSRTESCFQSSKTSYTHITQSGDALPAPVVWMSMDTAFENPFVPFAVGKVPETYHALRDTYDPAKMYWTSNEVMALTQGYFDVMAPIVKEAVERSEADSRQVIRSSLGLSKEEFAEKLRENSRKIFADWKQLSVRLLQEFKANVGIKYERQPTPDTPTEY